MNLFLNKISLYKSDFFDHSESLLNLKSCTALIIHKHASYMTNVNMTAFLPVIEKVKWSTDNMIKEF